MRKFEGGVHINAPIENVWDIITRIEASPNTKLGLEGITISPDRDRLEPHMDIRLKVGYSIVRGLVHLRIDEVDDERHYFKASVLETAIEKPLRRNGIRGNAVVGLFRSPEDHENQTDLKYKSALHIPFALTAFIMPIKDGIVDKLIMPGVGESIARKAQRLRYESDEEQD
jgi:hypothetical protein